MSFMTDFARGLAASQGVRFAKEDPMAAQKMQMEQEQLQLEKERLGLSREEMQMKQQAMHADDARRGLLKEASQQGGIDKAIKFLDEKDPLLGLEVRKASAEYESSIATAAKTRAEADEGKVKAAQASMIFVGQFYHTAEKQPPEVREEMYQKFLPQLRQHDPDAPDTYDPVRAKIAEGYGISQLEEFKMKQDQEEKANAPTTDVEKIEFAKRNAIRRGDKEVYDKLVAQEENDQKSKLQAAAVAGEKELRGQYLQQRNAIGDVFGSEAIIKDSLTKKSTAGDVAAIYQYVKLNDPNAVREGEIALSTAVYGYKKIDKWIKQTQEGTPLTQEQRDELAAAAATVTKSKNATIKILDKSFKDIATRNGWNPENTTPQVFQGPTEEPVAPGMQAAPVAPKASGNDVATIEAQAAAAIKAGYDPKAVEAHKQQLLKELGG